MRTARNLQYPEGALYTEEEEESQYLVFSDVFYGTGQHSCGTRYGCYVKYHSTWYFPMFSMEQGSTAVVPAMAVTLSITVPGIFRCFLQNRGAQLWYPLWLLR